MQTLTRTWRYVHAMVAIIFVQIGAGSVAGQTISAPTSAADGGSAPGAILVSWGAVEGASAYYVRRSTAADFSTAALVATNSPGVTQFFDERAEFGETYYYWVTVWAESGEEAHQANPSQAAQRTLLWKFESGGAINGAPAIGPDGTIYVATTEQERLFDRPGKIIALRSDGTQEWEFVGPKGFVSTPAVDERGDVYAINMDNHAYAISREGTLKWKVAVKGITSMQPSRLSPAITGDGLVLLPTTNGLSALTADGQLLWSGHMQCLDSFSPVVGRDGTIYMMGARTELVALDRNGNLRWRLPALAGPFSTQPIILENGNVLVGEPRPQFLELTPSGETNRVIRTPLISVGSTPVASGEGRVHIALSDNRILTAFDDGSAITNNAAALPNTFALAADDTLYFAGRAGAQVAPLLFSLGADGTPRTNLFGRGDGKTPTIREDGTILIGSSRGALYAVKGSAGGATRGWPAARFDTRQSGNRSGKSGVAGAPRGLNATKGEYVEQVRLSWEAFNELAIMEIWRGTEPDLASAGVVGSNILSPGFIDAQAAAGQQYYYWARATNAAGVGEFAGPVTGSAVPSVSSLWKITAPTQLGMPTLARDGTIYTAGTGRELFAWTPEGQMLWRVEDVTYSGAAPVIVGPDERIHTWDGSRWVVISPAGAVLKRTPLLDGVGSLELAVSDLGAIFVNGLGLRAFSPDGEFQWAGANTPSASPAIDAGGNVFVAENELYQQPKAVTGYSPAGAQLWTYLMPAREEGVVLRRDGGVLAADRGGKLHAISASGSEEWVAEVPNVAGGFGSTMIVGTDGTIFNAGVTNVFALDATGTLKWVFPARAKQPMVSAQGTLYLDAAPGIIAVSATGQEVWRYGRADKSVPPPAGFAMSDRGVLYFSSGNELVALSTLDSLAKDSWSTPRGNMQRTGQLLAEPAAELQLLSVVAGTDNNVQIRLRVSAGSNAKVQVSADLNLWRDAAGRKLEGQVIELELGATDRRQFFRAVLD